MCLFTRASHFEVAPFLNSNLWQVEDPSIRQPGGGSQNQVVMKALIQVIWSLWGVKNKASARPCWGGGGHLGQLAGAGRVHWATGASEAQGGRLPGELGFEAWGGRVGLGFGWVLRLGGGGFEPGR